MREKAATRLAIGLLVVLLLISRSAASTNELEYRVDFTEITVYRDGLVHVTQSFAVNETLPSISSILFAASIENIIVVDENQTVLDYETDGLNLTVFSLGAKRVLLEYDTISLTRKEAGVWTLILDSPYNVTVYLPEESTIVYLNEVPASVDTEDGKIVLSLFPSWWEISYVMPIVPPATFRVTDLTVTPTDVESGEEITILARVSNIGEAEGFYTVVLKIDQSIEDAKTVTLGGGESITVEFRVTREDPGTYNIEVAGLRDSFTVKEAPPQIPIPAEYLILGVALLIIGGVVMLLRRGKPSAEKILKGHPHLRQEDKEVIEFIVQKGGKVFEAQIRERFPDLPRTTLWRLIRRLEKMEIVTIRKIGMQNQIELRRK